MFRIGILLGNLMHFLPWVCRHKVKFANNLIFVVQNPIGARDKYPWNSPRFKDQFINRTQLENEQKSFNDIVFLNFTDDVEGVRRLEPQVTCKKTILSIKYIREHGLQLQICKIDQKNLHKIETGMQSI